MNQPRIVFCDLDGTLLDRAGRISQGNRAAIAALATRGILFVPSSGRTLEEIPAVLREDPSIRYIMYSNGAVILDKETGKRTEFCLSRAAAAAVTDTLSRFDTHLTVRRGGCSYIAQEQSTPQAFAHANVPAAHVRVLTEHGRIADLSSLTHGTDGIEMIAAAFHSEDELDACRRMLERMDGIRVAKAAAFFLEIFSDRAGKGLSLRALCDTLGIPHEASLAVGDSENDLSMLTCAGRALAMGNACDALKAIADAVVCTNEEDVVAYLLAHGLA